MLSLSSSSKSNYEQHKNKVYVAEISLAHTALSVLSKSSCSMRQSVHGAHTLSEPVENNLSTVAFRCCIPASFARSTK